MQKKHAYLDLLLLIICIDPAGAAPGPAVAHDSQTNRWGAGAAVAFVPFVGGMSGPETPLSATRYSDTFNPGYGLRLEGYYDWSPKLRIVLGGVHNAWTGRYFAGGEFPDGAQFGDFSLTGLYIGARCSFMPHARLRPYVFGNIGVAMLSAVDVHTDSGTFPYWDDTLRDYLDVGAGLDYACNQSTTIYLDVRLELFGKPDSAQPNTASSGTFTVADSTGGSALPISLGINYSF